MLGSLFGDDLARARREAFCVIMPNRPSRDAGDIEGFGLVAPETSMVGGIVLASAVDGIVSAVRDNETGFLLDPDNVEAWANRILALDCLEEEEREAFTARAATLTRKHYSWERVARQTLDVYRASLTQNSPMTSC